MRRLDSVFLNADYGMNFIDDGAEGTSRPIAVRVFGKTRARIFSFWFQKFLILAPKRKKFSRHSFSNAN